jgi:hypothetical protein
MRRDAILDENAPHGLEALRVLGLAYQTIEPEDDVETFKEALRRHGLGPDLLSAWWA